MKKVIYGIHKTPLGVDMVIGQTEKGLCWIGFMTTKAQGAYKGDGFDRMKQLISDAEFVRDDKATADLVGRIMAAWEQDNLRAIPFDLYGTDFQKSVWEALLNIPAGTTVSYGDVANDIGRPKACRAVGTAVGENPISLLIPCHRVVRSDGGLGNYGWGLGLKEQLLKAEKAL